MIIRLITMAVIITGLCCFVPAGTVCSETVREEISANTVRDITPREEQIISRMAAKVLRFIADARGDIQDKKIKPAKQKIEKSLRLLSIIKDLVPVVEVKDHIWVAKKHLSYEDTERVKADLVPIYASLDELADIVPVDTARQHIDEAKQGLDKKDKIAAEKAFILAEESLSYSEIDLPVAFTEMHLNAAKKFLAAGETKKADEALQAAEEGVLFVSVDRYAPITLAKRNVSMAIKDYAVGSFDKAKQYMKAAIYNLKKAAAGADEKMSKAAEKLSGDVAGLEKEMKAGGRDISKDLKALWLDIDIAGTERMVLDKFRKQGRD